MSEECIDRCAHVKVRLAAHSMSAIFDNPDRIEHTRYVVDGCLVKNASAADCAIEAEGHGLIVVEFKGRNVENAIKQVAASVEFFRNDRQYSGKIGALIVARESPLGSATLNRHREKFARAHRGAALKVASSSRSFSVPDLLKHR